MPQRSRRVRWPDCDDEKRVIDEMQGVWFSEAILYVKNVSGSRTFTLLYVVISIFCFFVCHF